MVATATKLIEEQGYAATGLKQLLAESEAPRGSFYFHFPGGKEELAAAVVANHATKFAAMLGAVLESAPTPLAAAELSVEALASQFEGSGCASGCPVTAIAFEMANRSELLRDATRAAYDSWAHPIADRLVADGRSAEDARATARTLLAAIEGALILSRAYGSRGPLDDLKTRLEPLLRA